MTALELLRLLPLMARTAGRPGITVGLIDGPVSKGHPDLENENIRDVPARPTGVVAPYRAAPLVSTGHLLQGILVAKRGSAPPSALDRVTTAHATAEYRRFALASGIDGKVRVKLNVQNGNIGGLNG
jgi:hypothetical protein